MTPLVSTRKVTEYLLNVDHPDGGSKAKFFLAQGYSVERPEELARALIEHACDRNFRHLAIRTYGTHAIFEGAILTPRGTKPRIRTVWQKLSPAAWLAFVTAYPLG